MAISHLSKSARERLERQRIDQRYNTARTLIRVICVVVCVWLIGNSVSQLAGKNTNVAVSAALSIFADLKFAFSLTLAGCATAWAAIERWLRHRKVEHLQGRVRDLETSIDPSRSTSNLTTKGKTNPRDHCCPVN